MADIDVNGGIDMSSTEPVRRSSWHQADAFSLVMGLLFLALGGFYLAHDLTGPNVDLRWTGPAALIHLYPLTAPSTPNAIDPIAAADVHDLVLAQHADRHAFLNIDGVVRCGAGDADGNSTLHVQAFRSGALEAFVSLATPHVDGGVALLWVQQMVSMLVPSWLRGLETLDVPGPYHFAVTLVGVRGTRPVRVGGDELQWGVASREETLLLPAWTITPGETDWARLLQELQRLLHQAYGRDGVDTVYFGPDGAY